MRHVGLIVLLSLTGRGLAQELQVFSDKREPRKLLYNYLLGEAKKHFDDRRQEVAKLKTPEDIKKRQDYLRGKFLEALGGFPDRTPLNAKVAGTLRGDGFRVEKVIHEIR